MRMLRMEVVQSEIVADVERTLRAGVHEQPRAQPTGATITS